MLEIVAEETLSFFKFILFESGVWQCFSTTRSGLFEPLVLKFQRPAIFGDRSYHLLRYPVLHLGVDFESDRHTRAAPRSPRALSSTVRSNASPIPTATCERDVLILLPVA
jgi:hypothetical protein